MIMDARIAKIEEFQFKQKMRMAKGLSKTVENNPTVM